MNKLQLLACGTLLGLTPAVQAATEFPDGLIPVELAREFGAGGQVYSSLPDNFPLADLQLDIDLQLIGSVVPDPRYSQVLLRSDNSVDEVANALAPALLQRGWEVLYSVGNEQQRTASLCHDQHGELYLTARDQPGDGMRLTIMLQPRASGSPANCAVRRENDQRLTSRSLFIMRTVPYLTLPSGGAIGLSLTPGTPLAVALSLNPTYEYSANTSGENYDATGIYDELAAQLEELGWQEDSYGAGGVSTSGVWVKTIHFDNARPEDINLALVLTVLKTGNLYEVAFKMKAGRGG